MIVSFFVCLIIAYYWHLDMIPPLVFVHHDSRLMESNVKEQVLGLLEFQNSYPLFPLTQHLEYLAATWGCYLCPLKLRKNQKIQSYICDKRTKGQKNTQLLVPVSGCRTSCSSQKVWKVCLFVLCANLVSSSATRHIFIIFLICYQLLLTNLFGSPIICWLW